MQTIDYSQLELPVLRTAFGELSCIGISNSYKHVEFINTVWDAKARRLRATKKYVYNVLNHVWSMLPYVPDYVPSPEEINRGIKPRLISLNDCPRSLAVLQAILDPKVDGKQFAQALIDFGDMALFAGYRKIVRNHIFGLSHAGCSILGKVVKAETTARS